jgi:hypothetical protein
MPYKDRTTYLAKQREFAARRRAAKRTANPSKLPESKHDLPVTHRRSNPVNPVLTQASKCASNPPVNAARTAPKLPERVSPTPVPRNAPQTGLTWLGALTAAVASGTAPNHQRPKSVPTHAQVPTSAPAAISGQPTRAAAPSRKAPFRLPDHLQAPRKSPAVGALIKRMFG